MKTKSLLDEKGIQHGRVAVLGLAFKGNIDDMRESPSTDVLHHLEKLGVDYTAFDPHIKENKIERQTQSLDEAVAHADVILILTDHNEFKELLPSAVENHMRTKVIFDTKNCIQRDQWKAAGFDVVLLGDSKVSTL